MGKKKLLMEDFNATPEELYRLSHIDRLNQFEIGKHYGVNKEVIYRWMTESNLKPSLHGKMTFNERYFDVIDTPEKAYWLGFVWCDGYVWDGTSEGYSKYKLTIDLAEVDHGHLEKFRLAISAKSGLYKVKVSKNSKSKKEWKSRFSIGGSYMCKCLIEKYEMVPYRNTVDKLKENIPYNLMRHFIRGVLDADGSITHSTHSNQVKQRSVSFTVTEPMGDYIRAYLLNEGIIKKKLKLSPDKIGGTLDVYSLAIGGNIQAERLLDHLYEGSTIHLDRKYNTYINFKIEKGWITLNTNLKTQTA